MSILIRCAREKYSVKADTPAPAPAYGLPSSIKLLLQQTPISRNKTQPYSGHKSRLGSSGQDLLSLDSIRAAGGTQNEYKRQLYFADYF